MSKSSFTYDLVISFANENRYYAQFISDGLKRHSVSVFYDLDEQFSLWGKNLAEELQRVYSKEGRYCLLLLSKDYLKKVWTRLERRAAISRALRETREYLLVYVLDDTTVEELEGVSPDIGYIDSSNIDESELIPIILKKLKKEESSWKEQQRFCTSWIMRRLRGVTSPLESPWTSANLRLHFFEENSGRLNGFIYPIDFQEDKTADLFQEAMAELIKSGYVGFSQQSYFLTDKGKEHSDEIKEFDNNNFLKFLGVIEDK